MQTTLLFIKLIFPLAVILVPLLFYKKKFSWLMRFYNGMAYNALWRKRYVLAVAVVAWLCNFVDFCICGQTIWLIPAFTLCFCLLHESFMSATLHWLHDDRMLEGLAFATFLFTLMYLQLYSLSITIALVMAAAMFYPSRDVLRIIKHKESIPGFDGTEEAVFTYYF